MFHHFNELNHFVNIEAKIGNDVCRDNHTAVILRMVGSIVSETWNRHGQCCI